MKPVVQQTIHRLAAISLAGLFVGLIAAFATAAFVELVHYLNQVLFVSAASRASLQGLPLAMITIAVLTGGGLVVGLILRYGVRQGEPVGPADSIFAVQLHEPLPTPGSGLSTTLATILALGCGASVGQYGPLVYLGTLVGQLSNRLPLGLPHIRSITIACGVAAAISTAFNAPIAALIFTHEVILRHYSLRMFSAVTVASACGYFVANVVFEYPPLFPIAIDASFRAVEFPLFAIEGIACGVLAVIYMKSLQFSSRLSQRVKLPSAMKPMLAGFIVSLVALRIPEVLGLGQDVVRAAILGNGYGSASLLLILIAKLLVTAICIGFGFAGGVISPAMLIGILFGSLFGQLLPALFLDSYSNVSDYAICGMVALMSPVIGAPMTALLLVFEMTRNYEITIAAMVAIVFSNLVASGWYGRSFYDQQLAGRGIDLSMGRARAYLTRHKVGDQITNSLPVLNRDARLTELRYQMAASMTASAVIVDDENRYLGLLFQRQLAGLKEDSSIAQIEFQETPTFNEHTSIWEAMQVMRSYLGEAIAVVDSGSGRYLGAIPEAVVINAYLDATEKLRREEFEV
jgi:CIC family chloride channel protein